MPHPVLDAAEAYRRRLLAQERQAASRLVRAYGRAYTSISDQVQALEQQLLALGDDVSRNKVRELAILRSLQRQIAEEVERYAVYADVEISAAVSQSIEMGLDHSRGMVAAHFPAGEAQAAVRARFDMLAAEAVETALGFTAADSPLRARLVGQLGPVVAEQVGDALVNAIATGVNPRQTARIIRDQMGQGLTWSLTTARTAQLWAYRDAARLNYVNNSDIVSGWRWLSALDSRTCMSCINKHGQEFPVEQVLNDHHNGRCTQVPIVPAAQRLGIQPPNVGSGEDWFNAQPESVQRDMMGPATFEAWKAGEFKFADLSQPYTDPVYGDMVRQAKLYDLVGKKQAKKFISTARTERQGTSVPQQIKWQPSLPRAQAEEWAKESAVQVDLLHMTNERAANAITQNGFSLSEAKFGRVFGDGVYMTEFESVADRYVRGSTNPKVLRLKVNVSNPLTVETNGPAYDSQFDVLRAAGISREEVDELAASMGWESAITQAVKNKGYDSIHVIPKTGIGSRRYRELVELVGQEDAERRMADAVESVGGDQWVIFDTNSIVVIND